MLPSNTELRFAKIGKLDIYTVTNLSFMDIAMSLKIKPNLYAVTKADLSNRKEHIEAFSNLDVFTQGDVSIEKTETDSKQEEDINHHLKYDAEFDIVHDRETIYEVSAKFKDVVGVVDDLLVLEKESYDVLLTELKDQFTIEKAVKLHLKDYKEEKTIDILKIKRGDKFILIISDTLTY